MCAATEATLTTWPRCCATNRGSTAAIPPIRHPNPRITLGTFYRHLLPGLLRDEYRALLYMDTDTWLRRPGIQGLFDRIAGDYYRKVDRKKLRERLREEATA